MYIIIQIIYIEKWADLHTWYLLNSFKCVSLGYIYHYCNRLCVAELSVTIGQVEQSIIAINDKNSDEKKYIYIYII